MSNDENRRQKQLAKKAAARKAKKQSSVVHDKKLSATEKQIVPQDFGNLIVTSYEVTFDPVENEAFDRLPEAIKDELSNIHDIMMNRINRDSDGDKDISQVIERLLAIIQQYSDVPSIYNYLYNSYKILGDTEHADRVLQETIDKFPDYLFARIAQADECMRRNEFEQVPIIFENKFDLSILYPERKVFHISEVMNFSGIMAQYFYSKGDIKRVELYYKIMKRLDPKRKYLLTQNIYELLFSRISILDKIRNIFK